MCSNDDDGNDCVQFDHSHDIDRVTPQTRLVHARRASGNTEELMLNRSVLPVVVGRLRTMRVQVVGIVHDLCVHSFD
jgi:hypothetical protein